jgi:hypothetical protein
MGKLDVFDKSPLVVPLGISIGYLIGINLHWIEKTERKKFFKFAYLRYQKAISKITSKSALAKFPFVLYTEMKKLKTFQKGLGAIRKYIISRITSLIEVPESEYPNIFTTKYRARFAYKDKGYVDAKSAKKKIVPKTIVTKPVQHVTKKQVKK